MCVDLTRILPGLVALAVGVLNPPVQAAPADPFTGASQSFEAAPKEGVNYNAGDWGVADQVGAATYTFAIPVPPGRNGMAPALALRYSSGSPLRGGIAAGWTLSLPTIEQDHALGVDGGLRYKAALGSAVGRLVAVPDDIPFDDGDSAYRVDFDDGFTRFFRRKPDPRNYSWTALTADGIKHHFSKYSIDGPDPRWRIEREEDPYGNTILYSWSPVRSPSGTGFIDYSLDAIEYASNAAAGLVAYARVQFAYEDLEVCEGAEVPLGAALRPGSREVDGARRLSAVRTFVRDTQDSEWRPSRHFALRYEIGTSTLSSFEQPEVEPDQPPADEPPPGGLPDQGEAAEPGQVATDKAAPEGKLPPEQGVDKDPGQVATDEAATEGKLPPEQGVDKDPGQVATDEAATEGKLPPENAGDQDPGQVATDEAATEGELPPEDAGDEDPGDEIVVVPPRVLTLACKQNPLRYLTQIDIEAHDRVGTATKLPPITFAYNRRLITTQIPFNPFLPNPMDTVEIPSPGFAQYGISGRVLGGIQGNVLDVDGDGIRDRISVVREDDLCKLVWRKGLLGGGFAELEHEAALPTAKWYEDWKGRQAPANIAVREGCTLNGQIAYRDHTQVVDQDQGVLVSGVPAKGIVSYHFMDFTGDGRLDLLTNVWATACHWTYAPTPEPIDGNPCSFPQDGLLAAAAPQLGDEPPIGSPNLIPMSPEEVAPGSQEYLWHVYPGVADPDDLFGVLAQPARSWPVRSPLPLPPSASDERLDLSQVLQISIQPLVDIDGDGFLDIVDTRDTGLTDCTDFEGRVQNELLGKCDWTVYFGDGKRFAEFSDAHLWRVPRFGLGFGAGFEVRSDTCGLKDERIHTTFADLHDISGDGLPDLLVQTPDLAVKAYVNHGDRFSDVALPLNSASPLERVQTDCMAQFAGELLDGRRGYLRRLLDLDADGLLDMLVVGDGEPVFDISGQHDLHALFNVGNSFGPSTNLPRAWEPVKRMLAAEFGPVENDPVLPDDPLAGEWHLAADFTDVTGDGLADLAEWDGETLTYISRPGLVNAPDLLSAVENGRGMRIEFSYAPSTDGEVVRWTGGAQPLLTSGDSALLPQVAWVVEQVKVSGGFDTPAMTTRYRYEDPRYLSPQGYTGIPERSRFAGFTRSIATMAVTDGPSRTVHREYGYLAGAADGRPVPAPNGLPLRKLTYHGDDLHRAQQTGWSYESLFDGEVQVPLRDRSQSCIADGPGISVADCLAMHNVRRIEETWTGIAPSTLDDPPELCPDPCNPSPVKAELYVRSARVEGAGSAHAEGDRRTRYEHEVRYGQKVEVICPPGQLPCDDQPKEDDYRVRVRQTVREMTDANLNYSPVGQTETVYSVAMGLPVKTREWVNADTIAETTRSYDSATGNLLSETKPEQASPGGSGNSTTLGYDSHKLFVESTTNEVGHEVRARYDVATGALVQQEGPNFKTLPPADVVWEQETFRIDGFGRVLEHSISVDDSAAGYALQVVDKTTHFDFEEPNRVRSEHLRDFGGDVWVTSDRTADGLGRPLSEIGHLDAGQVATTDYEYDSTGNLAAIEVPDPRTDGPQARYEYHHDGLNRLTHFDRPDDTELSITYAGLEKNIQEVTADGSGSTKKLVYDVFDHLIEVHEFDSENTTAITKYSYDANDNLMNVVTADGHEDNFAHDFVNNRIAVTRGDRTWRYVYDLNNNLREKTEPHPVGADITLFTTVYEYDDIDRVRAVNFADLEMATWETVGDLVTNTIRYCYDDGPDCDNDNPNDIGRLDRVQLPFGEVRYIYDARGLISSEQRSFHLTGIATVDSSQTVQHQYNALGLPTLSTWENGQKWQITYDERGLVDTVEWYHPQADTWKQVADYERGVASLPRTRTTSFGQGRQYAYDVLGRSIQDTVLRPGHPQGELIANRVYRYLDSGDLRSVSGVTDGISAAASYTYDALHRLKTAVGPNGYRGSFTYSPTGNVLTSDVSWDDSPERRNVRYEYGARDPQAVDRLVKLSEGGTYAKFVYDLAGNMIERTTPEGTWALDWDGRNQIRRIQSSKGTELYFYDHEGARMLAVNETNGVRFWFAESETHYGLDGAEIGRYLHLSGEGPTLARVENGTEIELQYADALQNLMLSLDSEGDVLATFFYGPFGEVVQATGDENHRRQFNGKENDALAGLRYYGFRYYDPLIQRWNSADPLYHFVPDQGLSEPQRLNLYTFSLNNPVHYYDPDGRRVEGTCEAAVENGEACTDQQPEEEEQDADDQVSRPDPADVEQHVRQVTSSAAGTVDVAKINDVADQAVTLLMNTALSRSEAIAKVNSWITEETQQKLLNPSPGLGPARPNVEKGPYESLQQAATRQLEDPKRFTGAFGFMTGIAYNAGVYLHGESHDAAMNRAKAMQGLADILGSQPGKPNILGQSEFKVTPQGPQRQVGGIPEPALRRWDK